MLRGERDVRHADPYARLHVMANRNITGKTKSTPRASVCRQSANNIQQGKAESDNPGIRAIVRERCKQSPNGKAKG